jgi:CRISPR system Cascade subunit CasB
MSDISREVYKFVDKKIALIEKSSDQHQRAILAKLRRGLGKPPDDTPEIWDMTLINLQDQHSEQDQSIAELVTHIALTFYALHRQGKESGVSSPGVSFGLALARLIDKDNTNMGAIKRRFDIAMTSKNAQEFVYHARGLVQLLRASDLTFDYPDFARDLYRIFRYESRDALLKWGRDFHHANIIEDGE